MFTAERKRAYEVLHPETAHGGDRKSSRQVGDLNAPGRFTADTAAKTGRSERAVQRDAERGEGLAVTPSVTPERKRRPRGRRLSSKCLISW